MMRSSVLFAALLLCCFAPGYRPMAWLTPLIAGFAAAISIKTRNGPGINRDGGWGARLAFTASGAVFFAGCAYNGSPIHSQLNDDELRSRVEARWTVGMSPPDAALVARRAALTPFVWAAGRTYEITADTSQFRAQVSRPGLRGMTFPPRSHPGDARLLIFSFEDGRGLNRVEYSSPKPGDFSGAYEKRVVMEHAEPSP